MTMSCLCPRLLADQRWQRLGQLHRASKASGHAAGLLEHKDATSGKACFSRRADEAAAWEQPEERAAPTAPAAACVNGHAQMPVHAMPASTAPAQQRPQPQADGVSEAARKAALAALAAQQAYEAASASSWEGGGGSGNKGGSKKASDAKAAQDEEEQQYSSHAERLDAFHALLADKGIAVYMKWADVAAAVSSDPRYEALPTSGQHKTAFNEWLQAERKRERQERRAAAVAARGELHKLLALMCKGATLPEGADVPDAARVLTPDMGYAQANEVLAGDPRWRAMEDEQEDRRDTYVAWMREEGARQGELRRGEEAADTTALHELLEHWLVRERITLATAWSDVKGDLAGEPFWGVLGKKGVLEGFKDFVLGHEQRAARAVHEAQDRLHRVEREMRNALLTALRTGAGSGDLHGRMSLDDVKSALGESPELQAYTVFAESGGLNEEAHWASPGEGVSGPRPPPLDAMPVDSILGRFLEDTARLEEKDCRVIDTTARRCGAGVTPDTTFQEWSTRLVQYEEGAWGRHHPGDAQDWEMKRRAEQSRIKAEHASADAGEGADEKTATQAGAAGEGDEGGVAEPAGGVLPMSDFTAPYPGFGRVEVTPAGHIEYGSGKAADGTPIFGPVHRMLRFRPHVVKREFDEYKKRAEEVAQRRAELDAEDRARYADLLKDYYYRSDHVDIPWEEAQGEMGHRTAFRRLPAGEQECMWTVHMAKLRAALEGSDGEGGGTSPKPPAPAAPAAAAEGTGGGGADAAPPCAGEEGEVGSADEGEVPQDKEAAASRRHRSSRHDSKDRHRSSRRHRRSCSRSGSQETDSTRRHRRRSSRDDGEREERQRRSHRSHRDGSDEERSQRRSSRRSHRDKHDSRPSQLSRSRSGSHTEAQADAPAGVAVGSVPTMPAMPDMPDMPMAAAGRKSAADIAAAVAAATAAAARLGGTKRPLESAAATAADSDAQHQLGGKRARGGKDATVPPPTGPVTLEDAFGGDDSEEEGEVR